MLAALLLVQSTEGNVASSSPSPPRSCADSATLEYPAGTGATAASTVAPYEEIGGTAGLTFAAWVYRESTTPHTDTPVIFNFQSSASSFPGQISLTFKSSMFCSPGIRAR